MSVKHLVSCAAVALLPFQPSVGHAQTGGLQHLLHGRAPVIEAAREALGKYRDPAEALAAGYVAQTVCVSGPDEGAMGVHFVKLPFDGVIELEKPEALVYEPVRGGLRLVAAEYIAPATPWHDANGLGVRPQLEGHLFHYVPGPNRYGDDTFYELHVWAFGHNPSGAFADWNPNVSCAPWAP